MENKLEKYFEEYDQDDYEYNEDISNLSYQMEDFDKKIKKVNNKEIIEMNNESKNIEYNNNPNSIIKNIKKENIKNFKKIDSYQERYKKENNLSEKQKIKENIILNKTKNIEDNKINNDQNKMNEKNKINETIYKDMINNQNKQIEEFKILNNKFKTKIENLNLTIAHLENELNNKIIEESKNNNKKIKKIENFDDAIYEIDRIEAANKGLNLKLKVYEKEIKYIKDEYENNKKIFINKSNSDENYIKELKKENNRLIKKLEDLRINN